jgi:hypothetical protein
VTDAKTAHRDLGLLFHLVRDHLPDVELRDAAETAVADASAAVDAAVLDAVWGEIQALSDAGWRRLLDEARARRAAPMPAPLRDERPRAALLARRDELLARYPTLAMHHRSLAPGELSDEELRALVQDLEALVGAAGAPGADGDED